MSLPLVLRIGHVAGVVTSFLCCFKLKALLNSVNVKSETCVI